MIADWFTSGRAPLARNPRPPRGVGISTSNRLAPATTGVVGRESRRVSANKFFAEFILSAAEACPERSRRGLSMTIWMAAVFALGSKSLKEE